MQARICCSALPFQRRLSPCRRIRVRDGLADAHILRLPEEQKAGSMTSEEVLQAIRLQWELVLQGKVAMTRHGYV